MFDQEIQSLGFHLEDAFLLDHSEIRSLRVHLDA